MIIAVTTEWGNDFERFAYYRVENGKLKEREEAPVAPGGAEGLAKQLVGLEVDLLLGCQLSGELCQALDEAGVLVIGNLPPERADVTLTGYLDGSLNF